MTLTAELKIEAELEASLSEDLIPSETVSGDVTFATSAEVNTAVQNALNSLEVE